MCSSSSLSAPETIEELPEDEDKEENEENDDEEDILVQLHQPTSDDEMDAPFEPPTIIPHRPVLRRRDSMVTVGTTITCDTADIDGMTIVEEERDIDAMIFEERAETGRVSIYGKRCHWKANYFS